VELLRRDYWSADPLVAPSVVPVATLVPSAFFAKATGAAAPVAVIDPAGVSNKHWSIPRYTNDGDGDYGAFLSAVFSDGFCKKNNNK